MVHLEAGGARNGAVDGGAFVSPRDDASIALLGEATCGDSSEFRD